MPRKFVSFRSIGPSGTSHLAAGFWITVLLSICHITDVNATMPGVQPAPLTAKTDGGARFMPVRYCEDGYECGDRDPAPQYHARGDGYDDHYDKGWYTRPDRYESDAETECEDGYEIVEVRPRPEAYDYDPYYGYTCGVRCWYKRLTSGYCGRGCEYYLYRLGKTRTACRSRH